MKYIFVDLDECLLHTSYFYGQKPSDDLAKGYGQFHAGNYLYVAELRPGALDLLKRIREIVPTERVFMLTTSVADYAAHWNEYFGLGFQPDQIYSREHIQNLDIDAAKFPQAEAYHIDNLSRGENRMKIQFLRQIDHTPTYIQVTEFIESPRDDFTEKELSEVIGTITADTRLDRQVVGNFF